MCGQLSTASKMTFKTPKPVNFKSQGIPENTHKMKGSRPKSNDPCLNVKVFCNLCDGVYQMSGLRKHIAHRHKMTKSAYIAAFGDLKKQIISLVYHSCGICKKTILLDTEIISKHTTKKHKIGYTAYAGKYMKKNSGLIKKENKTSVKKVEKKKPSTATSAPQSFGKEFWQNILSKKSGSSTSKSVSSSSKSPAASKPVSKSSPKLAPKTPAKKSMPASKPARKSPLTQTPSPATRTMATSKKPTPSTKPRPSSPVLPPTPPATPPIIKSEPVVKKEKEDIVMTDISTPAPVKNLIVIQCEICSKTFSKNIQLRAHTRKNHS